MLERLWREKEKRVVFRALCKTSNRPSLARSVDVRVVGPLGQVASHIASHMVSISLHCCRPSSNCQVMYRSFGISSPPSLLFFFFINGRHSRVVVMVVEVIVTLGLASCHEEALALTLYTLAGFTKVFISGASPLLQLLLFLLPSAVEGKSKLALIQETLFHLSVTTCTHQTVVSYRWKHTHPYVPINACLHPHVHTHTHTRTHTHTQCL